VETACSAPFAVRCRQRLEQPDRQSSMQHIICCVEDDTRLYWDVIYNANFNCCLVCLSG
jgi:hypothetical protein